MPREELVQTGLQQVGGLAGRPLAVGDRLSIGARDEAIAGAMVDAINSVGEPWVLYWPTPLERHRFYEIAGREGIPIIHEICADLDYRADGSLIVERVKQARDPSMIADRVQRFVEEGKLRTVDDTDLEFEAQAILVHGDGPNAAEVIGAVRTTLERMQVAVQPASTLVH